MDRLASVQGSTRSWYVGDALGSVRQILDGIGQPLTYQNYDPWGTPTGGTSPSAFGFTGEWQDSATGLVNLCARWYQPRAGRFLTRDPWEGLDEEPQTLAQYVYVHNDPINWTDPTGYWKFGGTSSPEHGAIEDQHLFRNAARIQHVHAEYRIPVTNDAAFGSKVDLMHSDTGDVYEIEPIITSLRAIPEALQKVDRLQRTNHVAHYAGVAYDWDNISWRLGEPSNFPDMRISNYIPGMGDLIAKSTAPGAVLFWIEPRPGIPLPALKQELARRGRSDKLARKPDFVPPIPRGPSPMPQPGFQPPSGATVTTCTIVVAVGITIIIVLDPLPGDEAALPLIWGPILLR